MASYRRRSERFHVPSSKPATCIQLPVTATHHGLSAPRCKPIWRAILNPALRWCTAAATAALFQQLHDRCTVQRQLRRHWGRQARQLSTIIDLHEEGIPLEGHDAADMPYTNATADHPVLASSAQEAAKRSTAQRMLEHLDWIVLTAGAAACSALN
jgi:hypothetical protein